MEEKGLAKERQIPMSKEERKGCYHEKKIKDVIDLTYKNLTDCSKKMFNSYCAVKTYWIKLAPIWRAAKRTSSGLP